MEAVAVDTKADVLFDANAQDFRRVLSNALLFTDSQKQGRAVLEAVQVEAGDNLLQVTATDSYKLGHDETPAEVGTAGAFLLDRADVTTLVKALKQNKYGTCRVEVHGSEVTAETLGARFTFRTVDGQYPEWRRLVPGENDDVGQQCEAFQLNGKHLSAFCKVDTGTGPGAVLKFSRLSATKPIKVTAGSFLGLIMTVRMD